MLQIGHFLKKIQEQHLSFDIENKNLIKFFEEEFKIKLNKKSIKIKKNIIKIEAHPIIKNSIYIKKTKILEKIEKLFGKKYSDIN